MSKLLVSVRFFVLIGVCSLLAATLGAFGWGALKTYDTMQLIIGSYGKASSIPIALIELVDAFLIATTLLVFAVSLYEMSVGGLTLPEWMLAHNLQELKGKLSSLLILVVSIKFVERLVEWKEPADTLLFGFSAAILSVVLIAFNYLKGKD